MNNNPFVPAEWGHKYDLAGAVWIPERSDVGQIIVIVNRPYNLYMIPSGWVADIYGKPLLPSPAWINAQANPRAVAIAALERAGFKRFITNPRNIFIGVHVILEDEQTDSAGNVTIEADGDATFYMDTSRSPALARYAVDCFEVLHAWAAAIKWEDAHDETA